MQEKFSFSRPLMLFSLLAVSFAQAGDDGQVSVTAIEVIAAKDFIARHENGVILDVRTSVEYEMSHITDAVNVNVQDDTFEQMVADLDRDQPYIVHCTKNPVDGRSAAALTKLQAMGFTNLINMEGGWVAWREAELPLIETGN